MAAWVLTAAARSHRGLLLEDNEDNFYLNGRWMPLATMRHGDRATLESNGAFQLYAVCDGMVGTQSGGQASHAAVEALGALQAEHPDGVTDWELLASLAVLTDRIRALPAKPEAHTGTTLTALLWQGQAVRVLNLGDSRVYRLRGRELRQLTTDHSEVQRMVGLGLMTPFQARLSPWRHLILRYLGLPSDDPAFQPYLSAPMPAQAGDRYLLCSDGLADMVEDDALRRILLRARDAAEATDRLVQQALDNGGRDNVTALCVRFPGSSRFFLPRRQSRPTAIAAGHER